MKTLSQFIKEDLQDVEFSFRQITKRPDSCEWQEDKGAKHYEIELLGSGRLVRFFYSMGSACGKPKKDEVIACLVMDSLCAEEKFEDFCNNYGYSSDSIKAKGIWEMCKETASKLLTVVGIDRFETMQSLENDI